MPDCASPRFRALALLVALSASGQLASSQAPSGTAQQSSPSGASTQPTSGASQGATTPRAGASPVRQGSSATGSEPAPAAQAGTPGAGTPGGSTPGSTAPPSQSPAPAANGKVEVTGRPEKTKSNQATQDHPLLPIASLGNNIGIRSGTPIRVRLKADADSGHVKNGDPLQGILAEPLAGMPVGTPVQLTVVQVARAGSMLSYGELSIQVVSINQHPVLSDTITALGKEGPKEQPDAAPARGTEAIFSADQTIALPAA